MIDRLKSLAVFAKTVEHGSFRAAARVLMLSPSVVSHHVTELEQRLGVPLLYRSTRHLALTSDGDKLYASAREMLDVAERGFDATSGRASVPAGRLRITAPALFSETRFSRDLAAFARTYPKVQLTVTFTERRQDLLREGYDLALRIGRLEDSSLKARLITRMPRALVASVQYASARPTPRTIRDLATWDHIQLATRRPELELVPPHKKQPMVLPYTARIVLDNAAAIREMVVGGLGLASLPELMVHGELARGRMVEVLPNWKLPEVRVYAVWPGGTSRPELTQRFVDFVEPRLVALFAP